MTRVELSKQLFRLRSYLALGLMIAIPTVMTVAFKTAGPPKDRRDHDLFALATHSGLNMPLAALSVMSSFLLPIAVAVFSGSTVAEESSWGTVRYLLVRPISRSRFLASKLTVVAAFTLLATALIALSATAEGLLAFGWHPVVTPSAVTISPGAALARLTLATIYVAWCMAAVVAFAFLVSTIVDTTMGAVAAGFGLAIISQILDAIPPLRNVRSVLPTHYWHAWESMFASSVATDHIVRGVLLQLPYVFVFLGLAWWWFHRKDILA